MKSFRNQSMALSRRRSPLQEAQHMSGKSGKKLSLRNLAQALPLTSLIDAFSIIVIYLLIGTQNGGLESQANSIQLPQAQISNNLNEAVTTLRILNRKLFLNDVPVTLNELEKRLVELKKFSSSPISELLVQADQNMQFSELDPLIKIGSLVGIEKLKFAVLPIR